MCVKNWATMLNLARLLEMQLKSDAWVAPAELVLKSVLALPAGW